MYLRELEGLEGVCLEGYLHFTCADKLRARPGLRDGAHAETGARSRREQCAEQTEVGGPAESAAYGGGRPESFPSPRKCRARAGPEGGEQAWL